MPPFSQRVGFCARFIVNRFFDMPTSFFQYEMLPTTWFYVSTLIILAVFFKFNRFWSVRNFDLLGLILITPGLILLAMRDDQWGYAWLFGVGFFAAIRLIFDTVMVRRPLLEPNLTPGGLAFSCFFLLCFVIAALTINRGDQIDTVRTIRLEQIMATRSLAKGTSMDPTTMTFAPEVLPNLPPGFLPFHALTERANLCLLPPVRIRREILSPTVASVESASTATTAASEPDRFTEAGSSSDHLLPRVELLSDDGTSSKASLLKSEVEVRPASLGLLSLIFTTAILGHLSIVFAFIYIGHCHFGNIRTGIACASLYLLHPYTNQMVGRLDHLIPAALILWAVAMYRRPFFSGLWIGTAAALVFYPIFLLPLWTSFYWHRGWIRFLIGTGVAGLTFFFLLLFSPEHLGSFSEQCSHLFGKSSLWIFSRPDGFWSHYDMIYRVPIMAVFFALSFGLILWPSHKHLAILLSCSSLLMISVQFCQLHEGGLFISWYLPLAILTVFRPNLEDRVAQSTVVI